MSKEKDYEAIIAEKEKEINELNKKIEVFEKEKKNKDSTETKFTKQLELMEKELKATQESLHHEKEKNRVREIKETVNSFVKDMKIFPAQGEILESIFKSVPDETVIKVFDKDSKDGDKELSFKDAMRKFISLSPCIADFSKTQTQEGIDTNDVENKIRQYCKEHKLDINKNEHYKQAYIVVGN